MMRGGRGGSWVKGIELRVYALEAVFGGIWVLVVILHYACHAISPKALFYL